MNLFMLIFNFQFQMLKLLHQCFRKHNPIMLYILRVSVTFMFFFLFENKICTYTILPKVFTHLPLHAYEFK